MPESTINTRIDNVTGHCERVKNLLNLNPQRLTNIQVHLGLTKPQTLSILQRLEEQEEIYCRAGIWRLTNK